ncbi:transport protein particle component [Parathielavia hyrcaniae]|uniref:Transport protein particle component n=1 Tax=Parathielavia hyrcaniae TaxID=113614 RepID=A0AAN6QGC8_9PEZI|nr:transport protein particle component [Parathielavia hyrcaniae]
MAFDPVMPPYNASDPTARFLSSSCLDFLLIELVPLAYRVTNEFEAGLLLAAAGGGEQQQVLGEGPRQQQLLLLPREEDGEGRDAAGQVVAAAATNGVIGGGGGSGPGAAGLGIVATGSSAVAVGGKGVGTGTGTVTGTVLDEEEEREAVKWRLEGMGYRVGQGLVERFSRDRPRFNDTLDVIKFLCKDLWTLVFRKQVDNLKTNHRGVYVLTDNSFRPFSRMSAEIGSQAVLRAQPFLWFPCGIVRGALAALGITATVQAETSELPSAVFQIKTAGAKA